MPRIGRVVVPNCAHHIVQRGHNLQVVFAGEEDFRYYLDTLKRWKTELGVKVYGYCLMTNHVHLVVEPPDEVAMLGRLMKRLAGRQTRYVNRLEGRRGTLWESRYKSSPIQTEAYLLSCCRYVDLNPVRARMVASPQDYRWSSYQVKAGLEQSSWLDEDPCYLSLGETRGQRCERYGAFVRATIPKGEWDLIRQAVQRGQLTGNGRFIDEIEKITGRRIEFRKPGNQPREMRAK
ncbi:MAG: transposase [Chromatiales bacterium 21-64-14]|nr:MAG: transposase [Chromatiales bacterium 21-64-14]HQU15320.1 transposase [Gammaproteobacteria bacterium]